MFLRKAVLKICSKYTGEHSCRSVISIQLSCNSIEIALQHGCSSVNFLHTFRTLFSRNTSGGAASVTASSTVLRRVHLKNAMDLLDNHYQNFNKGFNSSGNTIIFLSTLNITRKRLNIYDKAPHKHPRFIRCKSYEALHCLYHALPYWS